MQQSDMASGPNAEFIERCQIEYARNPASRVFAPLSEAYRRMGLIAEAFEVASRGVKLHPDFAAGRIAYARLLIEKKAFGEAVAQLKRAAELSPDNILAFQLLGDTHIELRRPKDALNAFKMVLFLNPLHERAQKMVRKWEFLTADEFTDKDFDWTSNDDDAAIESLNDALPKHSKLDPSRADREANRALSIADALTVRNDLDGAFAILGRTIRQLGSRPDLEQRLSLLGRRLGIAPPEAQRLAKDFDAQLELEAAVLPSMEKKKQKLKGLLKRLRTDG